MELIWDFTGSSVAGVQYPDGRLKNTPWGAHNDGNVTVRSAVREKKSPSRNLDRCAHLTSMAQGRAHRQLHPYAVMKSSMEENRVLRAQSERSVDIG
jgi:hypothetical protein